MNFCQHTKQSIVYRLGLLTEREKEEFEKHVHVCDICQRELKIESVIENELSVELQPGFIEERVCARVRLREARGMRSFWLYALRMVIYGVVAGVIGLVLFPLILRFPFSQVFDLSKIASGLSALTGPASTSMIIIGIGYLFIILSSLYSLSHIRK